MKLWPFVFILLALPPLPGIGQTVSSGGDEALSSELWELAISRYKTDLATLSLKPEEKAILNVKMAEAWIRSGHPAQALPLLSLPGTEKVEGAAFWKAQALAGVGKTEEAAAAFQAILAHSEGSHLTEAALTLANLQLTLRQEDAALQTLSYVTANPDPDISTEGKLRKVEILLDLNRLADAHAAMPAAQEIGVKNQPLADFLAAYLLLADGKASEAAFAFTALLSKPEGQSLTHYHSAAIGLADALKAQGDTEAAADSLLTFLQSHPNTPMLESIFSRLLEWMPEKPVAAEPILERLSQWIAPVPQAAMGAISLTGDGVLTATPVETQPNLLSDFSSFARAVALHRIGTPESLRESRILMNRLRMEPLPSFLANRVLLQSGRWLLDEGKINEAFLILDALKNSKNSSATGAAAFLEARTAFAAGDSKKAIQLFEQAASVLDEPSAQVARINARLADLLDAKDPKEFNTHNEGTPKDLLLQEEIQLEQAFATRDPQAARKAIEVFITQHPEHPRLSEARLFAIEAALSSSPPDIAFASTQLAILDSQPDEIAKLAADRMALSHLRLADLSKNTEETITLAKAIIDKFPNQPIATEARFTLGRNLFQSGSYNEARLVLEKLAASDADPARVQAALLIAARAAALGGTPKSREESLAIFDKAIAMGGPVTSIAVLEKARLMIDVIELNRLPEVVKFLRKWFQTLKEDDPLRLPTGLLLGEAITAQGSLDPKSMEEALSIYNQLLAHAKEQPALLHRLQYLRGMTLERLPEKNNPSEMRNTEALEAYYSVLESASAAHPPAEWDYFELCGFRAFEMLKRESRWEAAINVAEKIASFKGPKSAEAHAAAQKIRLDHHVWDE